MGPVKQPTTHTQPAGAVHPCLTHWKIRYEGICSLVLEEPYRDCRHSLGKRGIRFYNANRYMLPLLLEEIQLLIHSSCILILLKWGELILFNSCFTYTTCLSSPERLCLAAHSSQLCRAVAVLAIARDTARQAWALWSHPSLSQAPCHGHSSQKHIQHHL